MSYKTGFYEGRLGIGLSSTMGMGDGNPRYPLDINGDIRLTGSIVNGTGQVLSLVPQESLWTIGNSNLSYTGGNVGIGVSNPSDRFVVNMDSAETKVQFGIDGNTHNTVMYIGGASGNQRKLALISEPEGGWCRSNLHFCLNTTGDYSDVTKENSKMVIKNNGNVGIGTTSPNSTLHIKDDTTVLTLETTSGDVNGRNCYINFVDSAGQFAFLGDGGGANKTFYIYATRSQDIALMGGNVGIGVSNPTGSLHINSPNNFNFRMSQVGSSSWPGLQANFGAGGQHYDVYNTTTVKGFGSTGNGEYMYLNYYSGGGVRLASGTNVTSDNRLKHNEEIIENGIEIIKKIKPKKYFKSQKLYDEDYQYSLDSSGNPITDDDYIIETGLIAQEIMNIPSLKYLVEEIPDKKKIIKQDKKDNSGNYIFDASGNKITEDVEVLSLKSRYTVRYNDLFVYNIAATQELDKKVIALENENAELKSELAAIKQHLGI